MSGTDGRLDRPPVKGGSERISRAGGSRNRGFTYLGLLIIVAVMGVGLAATGTFWSHAAQREKERELLFVGHQFREAIASYYLHSPGITNAYPKTLDDLVEDKRFPTPQRHLRRIYADPLTGKAQWGLVEVPGGAGIMGVHSLAEEAPIKTGNFEARDAAFEDAKTYADWQFLFTPPPPAPPQAPKG
jgi:type II secretory pathway pseudopilin PulG